LINASAYFEWFCKFHCVFIMFKLVHVCICCHICWLPVDFLFTFVAWQMIWWKTSGVSTGSCVYVLSYILLTSSLCLQGGYYRNVGNAALMTFGVSGLLLAAGCMHALKQWGKQPYNNWRKQWMYDPLAGFRSGGWRTLLLNAMRKE